MKTLIVYSSLTGNTKKVAEAIAAYLRTLPETSRRAFVGRYYFLDPLKEVAAYCGISESNAKSLLYRIRLGLKDHLTQEGYL